MSNEREYSDGVISLEDRIAALEKKAGLPIGTRVFAGPKKFTRILPADLEAQHKQELVEEVARQLALMATKQPEAGKSNKS